MARKLEKMWLGKETEIIVVRVKKIGLIRKNKEMWLGRGNEENGALKKN